VGSLLWLASGVLLIAAGSGAAGFAGLAGSWQNLAFGGGLLGLLAMALYLHPWYAIGIAINVLIVTLLSSAVCGTPT
jgi:hypothetical protein